MPIPVLFLFLSLLITQIKVIIEIPERDLRADFIKAAPWESLLLEGGKMDGPRRMGEIIG